MAFQLVGVYDGTQEANAVLRTKYRPVTGESVTAVVQPTATSPSVSPSDLPGAGGNPVLIGVVSGLLGLVAGIWVGRKWRL